MLDNNAIGNLLVARSAWHVYMVLVLSFDRLKVGDIRAKYLSWLLQSCLNYTLNRAFEVSMAGDTVNTGDSAILICNHVSFLDYLLLLSQSHRFVAGAANMYFLIQGKCVRFLDLPLLIKTLQGLHSKNLSEDQVDSIFERVVGKRDQAPKLIVVFPEEEPFNELSYRLHRTQCEAAGAPILKNLLYPRFPQFCQALEYLRHTSRFRSLYDVTIVYNDPQILSAIDLLSPLPSLAELTQSQIPTRAKMSKVSLQVQRYDIAALPSKRKSVERWLEKRWYKKDQWIEKNKAS